MLLLLKACASKHLKEGGDAKEGGGLKRWLRKNLSDKKPTTASERIPTQKDAGKGKKPVGVSKCLFTRTRLSQGPGSTVLQTQRGGLSKVTECDTSEEN